MADFMMLMKAGGAMAGQLDWEPYIEALIATGKFRGGSALGAGGRFSKARAEAAATSAASVVGFMRFEADTIEEVSGLLTGNPHYESGGEVEILELVKT